MTIAETRVYVPPTGFSIMLPPTYRRLVVSLWGQEKTGKTSLALTFPEPLVFLNLDIGAEELLLTRPDLIGKVMHREIRMNELTDPATWGKLLTEFHTHYIAALEYADKEGGTVVVDTATQLWQIVQAVKIEHVRQEKEAKAEARAKRAESQAKADDIMDRATKGSQLDWQLANSFMGGLLRRALHHKRASAVFINRAKPKYAGANPVEGEFEYHGFGEMPAITQAHVRVFTTGAGQNIKHKAQINAARFNSGVTGFTIENPTFDLLHDLIVPAA